MDTTSDNIVNSEAIVEVQPPRQEEYPNLNAGNNNETHKWAEKWPTAEERILACERYCVYLRKGRSKKFYPEADENTIVRYMQKYPEEFRSEKIADAEREGLAYIESIGFKGMQGLIKNFNPTAWIFITKNKLGWRDKQDVTTDGKSLPVPIAGGQSVDVRPDNGNQ